MPKRLFWSPSPAKCASRSTFRLILCVEKGYIIVGQETDGTVTSDDAGLAWAVSKKKTNFVGICDLKRPDLARSGREQLVGLVAKDRLTVLEEGVQIAVDPNRLKPMSMLGNFTSAYWSENLRRSIAFGLVAYVRGPHRANTLHSAGQ